MKKLVLISSDARELYKIDVFRALCLPENYVLHFRYQRKYVDPDVLSRLDEYKKGSLSSAVVVFSTGNDLEVSPEMRLIENIPIRNVEIVEIVQTPETDLVHFYLKLKGFSDMNLAGDDTRRLPSLFVSMFDFTEPSNESTISWLDAVRNVKTHFPGTNFITAKILNKKGKGLTPTWNPNLLESYYSLHSEDGYLLDVAYARFDESKNQIRVDLGGLSVTSDVPNFISMGNPADNRRFSLNTGEIAVTELGSFIRFSAVAPTVSDDEEFSIALKLRLERNYRRSILFGLLSALLIFPAVFKVANGPAVDAFVKSLSTGEQVIAGLIIITATTLIVGGLHLHFNKK